MIDSVNPIRFDRPAQRLMQACCVLRRCGLLLLVILFCLLSQQRTVQAQSNNPPQVEPVADREMYVDDEIQINLDASDPNEFDTVTFIEVPSLLPLPAGAELFTSGDGSAFILFAPTAAGVYSFAVVAVDNGTPQGRTAVFFNVTVKAKPANFADMAITRLSVQSTAADGEIHRGAPFAYVVDVTNVSSATVAAVDATLTVILDRYLALQNSDDECTVQPPSILDTRLLCAFGSLAPGASRRVQLSVLPENEGSVTNQFVVDTTTLDPITVNDNNFSKIEVLPPLIDLAVHQRIAGAVPARGWEIGDQVQFQVTVENQSGVSTNFSLVETLAPGLVIKSVEGNGTLSCVVSGQQIFCESGIAAGGTLMYTIVAEIVQPGDHTTTAVVTGTHPDPDERNNRATAQLAARAVGDLRVSIDIPDQQGVIYVGDVIRSVLTVEAVRTTVPITFAEVTATASVTNGLKILHAETPVDVQCLRSERTLACTKPTLQSGTSFTIPILLYAERAGLGSEDTLAVGHFYRETTPGDNRALLLIEIAEPPLPWIYVHTFDDRNGNGLQDPGEPALPEVKIDTTSSDGQEDKVEQGATDRGGLLKQPLLDEPSRIQVTAKITPTQGITPVISVKLNAVPPTGQATISGGNACGMTVVENDGTATTLPCSAENQIAWVNQVNAAVADFAARLFAPPLQAAATNRGQLEPVAVTFVIDAVENQSIYLPLVIK